MNPEEHKDRNVECDNNFMVNIAYISPEVPSVERQALKILSFVVELVVLVYIRYNQRYLSRYMDERDCNIQHFAVEIQNVPLGYVNNEYRIKAMLQGIEDQNGEPIDVKEILILENLKEYLTLQK